MKTAGIWIGLLAALAAGAADLRLPAEARVLADEPADGKCWRQLGTIPLSYAAARNRMALELRRQGWVKVKTVDYDPVRWKTIEIWRGANGRIMVQYWREAVGVTGFAWGFLENGERS